MEISKRRKIRGLEEWKIGKGNGKRQRRDTRQRHSGTEERTRRRIATPTMSARNDGQSAFTLVELVIVIAIVIVLSVVSVPIYRSYVDKAKYTEAYALFGTILSAQKAYYSEYGNFGGRNSWTSLEPILGIDIRGNKYFTRFAVVGGKVYFSAEIEKQPDLINNGLRYFKFGYNITSGETYKESNDGNLTIDRLV